MARNPWHGTYITKSDRNGGHGWIQTTVKDLSSPHTRSLYDTPEKMATTRVIETLSSRRQREVMKPLYDVAKVVESNGYDPSTFAMP